MNALSQARAIAPPAQVIDAACRALGGSAPELALWTRELPRQVFGVESGMFYLPLAQALAWNERDSDWLRGLATALAVGNLYYVLHDTLVDEGLLSRRGALLLDAAFPCYLASTQALGVSAQRLLDLHRPAAATYTRALIRDLELRDTGREFRAEDVFRLGEKAAPGTVPLGIVAERCGRDDQSSVISGALVWTCSGIQLLDDLEDLRCDFAQGSATLPIAFALAASGQDRKRVNVEDLLDALYTSGSYERVLRLALHCLGRADQLLAATDAGVLRQIVGAASERAERNLRVLSGAREELSAHVAAVG